MNARAPYDAASDPRANLTDEVLGAQAPQILFVERCLELLKDSGRLAMIAPESMFCNPSHRYIIHHIESVARIQIGRAHV